ncbi:MFS transporter [Parahaliea aestuarii]|uniref:MFS transporter n=2 Tax=Parahaliea aestuarii TaxID=1852021 RepID=A0A5C9A2Z5_9GAMM|nr:MFS transporter [Parahaliea aestuarii]
MLGLTGFRIIYAPTFLPSYLHLLTGSPALVGLGQALLQAGALASPIRGAARIEQRHHILPDAVRYGSLMRLQILGLALAGWLLQGQALVLATLFFLLFLGYYTGAQRVVFQALLAKVIPIHRRGRLQAWRNFFGGMVAAALSWWAGAYLIENNWLGNGYATTFMLSFVLTSIGLSVLYLLIQEPAAAGIRPPLGLRDRLRDFRRLLEQRDYRLFLVAQLLATAGRCALPFCILYAGQHLALDGGTIGLLTLCFIGADTVSNLLWGPLGDRWGFRLVFLLALLLWMAAMLLVLNAYTLWQFQLVFLLLGAALSGYMMSATTMVLEFGDASEVPMRLALSTTAETSMAVLAPLLAGAVASAVGLRPLFLFSLAGLSLSLLIILLWVRDPRHTA